MAPLNRFFELPKLAYIEDLLEDCRVLVLGSELGQAAQFLARRAAAVVAIDSSRPRVRYYRQRFPSSRVHYVHCPLEATGEPDASFDVIIALSPPFTPAYRYLLLNELQRVLAPDGFLLLALPAPGFTPQSPGRRPPDIDPEALRLELLHKFPYVEMLVQHTGFAVTIGDEATSLPTYQLHGPEQPWAPSEYLALCSSLPIETEERLLATFPLDPFVRTAQRQLHALRHRLHDATEQWQALAGRLEYRAFADHDLTGVVEEVPSRTTAFNDALEADPALEEGLDSLMQLVSRGIPATRPAGPDSAAITGAWDSPQATGPTTGGEADSPRAREEIWRLESLVQTLEGENQRLEADLAQGQTEIQQLEAVVAQGRVEIQRLETAVAQGRSQIQRLEAAVSQGRAEVQQLEERNLDLQIELEEAEGALQSAEQVRLELLEQLKGAWSTVGKLSREIDTLRSVPAGQPVSASSDFRPPHGAEPASPSAAARLTDAADGDEAARALRQRYEQSLAREQLRSWTLEEQVVALKQLLEQKGIPVPAALEHSDITGPFSESSVPPDTLSSPNVAYDAGAAESTTTTGDTGLPARAPLTTELPSTAAQAAVTGPLSPSAAEAAGRGATRPPVEPAPGVPENTGDAPLNDFLDALKERLDTELFASSPSESTGSGETPFPDHLEDLVQPELPRRLRTLEPSSVASFEVPEEAVTRVKPLFSTDTPADKGQPSATSPSSPPPAASARPAPGAASARPASGAASTRPAPGAASTRPASGAASTRPAPGAASTRPAPGAASTRPAPAPEPEDPDETTDPGVFQPPLPLPRPSLEIQRALLDGWDSPPAASGLGGEGDDDASISYLLEDAGSNVNRKQSAGAPLESRARRPAFGAPLMKGPGAVSYPSAPGPRALPRDLPQRGEMALLEALSQKNLESLPSVTHQVEDEANRAFKDSSIEETIRRRLGAGGSGAMPGESNNGRNPALPDATVRQEGLGDWPGPALPVRTGTGVPGALEAVTPAPGASGPGPVGSAAPPPSEGLVSRLFSRLKR